MKEAMVFVTFCAIIAGALYGEDALLAPAGAAWAVAIGCLAAGILLTDVADDVALACVALGIGAWAIAVPMSLTWAVLYFARMLGALADPIGYTGAFAVASLGAILAQGWVEDKLQF